MCVRWKVTHQRPWSGGVLLRIIAWLCAVAITRLSGWRVRGDKTMIQRWRGHTSESQTKATPTGHARRPQSAVRSCNPWPWRAKPAGGQCRHSGNSLIRFQSLSSVVVSLLQPTHCFSRPPPPISSPPPDPIKSNPAQAPKPLPS